MKRLLMLKPMECASGDTRKGRIYDITEDILCIYKNEDEDSERYEYSKENVEKYSEYEQERWITIKDESSEDSFEVYEEEDRFIIFENDNELAHGLINMIQGLDSTIVNIAISLNME